MNGPNSVPEYRVYSKPSPVEHWRHLVEIVALVTAAVWAFYVFVYQERIKPSGEPPRLEPVVSVVHEPLQAGKELVTIIVTLKNSGATDISMGALLVNAYGVNYKGYDTGQAQETNPASGITIVNRGLKSSKPVLLYSHLSLWPPLGSTRLSFRMTPGEQFTLTQPFVVARGTYDTVRLMYAECYQRFDDGAVSSYLPKRTPDGGFDVADVIASNGAHAGLRCGGTSSYNGEYAL